MQIGRVSKKIGLTADTIRFYERRALLPRPARSAGGFRQYGEADIELLKFIRNVHQLGFTLREVRELVELRRGRLQPCAPVARRLEYKLAQVSEKVKELQRVKHELEAALRACNKELRKRTAPCPLLFGSGRERTENAK